MNRNTLAFNRMPTPKTQDQILSEFILSFSPQAIQQKQPLKGADPKLLINNESSVPRQTQNQQASQIVEETPPVTPAVTPAAPVIDENTVDFSSIQEMPMQQPVQQESQLRRLLTDPRTYETIANLGAAYSAYRGNEPLAQTLSGIAENIQAERVGREEAEREQNLALQKESAQSKKDTLKLEDDYRKEINANKVIKDTRDVNSAVSRMESVWSNYKTKPTTKSKNALDQALVITFNKMMDPGSVVRESEFARTPQGLSLFERFSGYAEKIKEGGVGLTDEARQEIIDISRQLQQGQINEANKLLKGYEELAIQRNLRPKNIFKYFKVKEIEPQQTQQAPQQAQQQVTDYSGISDEELMRGL